MPSATRPLRNITREVLEPLWSRNDITIESMAVALGVTRQAVSYKAKSLGLPSRAKVRRQLVDDATFARMWRAGVCCTDIANHFGYSHRSAVAHRRVLLDLPARSRSKGGTNNGGWQQTISLADYQQAMLAEATKAEAKGAAA